MRIPALAGVTLAGATLLAACGGGGGSSPVAAAPQHEHPTPAATAAVAVRTTSLGDVLVDAHGRTLYGFANDTNGTSTCTGACAANWPLVTVGAGWSTGSGRRPRARSTRSAPARRRSSSSGRWPLYHFAGDTKPGDVNGQGVEKFYAVRPDGSLVKDATATAGASTPSSSPSPMTAPAMTGRGY